MTNSRGSEQSLNWTMRLASAWGARNGHVARQCGSDTAMVHGDLEVRIATGLALEPAFRERWDALVSASPPCQRVYQSPAFFDAVSKGDERSQASLLAVTRAADGRLVAVVPVRLSRHEFAVSIAGRTLWRWRAPVVTLLGSAPARGGNPVPLSLVAGAVLALFPTATFAVLPALPQDGGDWDELSSRSAARQIAAGLLGNWRACHTMQVPCSLEAYAQQFTAKKRYNLKRQVRQLAEACGAVSLERIERVDQVDALHEAVAALRGDGAMARFQRRTTSIALAQNGLLLCFVLRTGEHVRGVVFATRSATVLHVHNIFVDERQRHLSVGTSTMHLAMENLISMACFTLIDFGYGTPKHDYGASHVLEMRTAVLVARRTDLARLTLAVHCRMLRMTERLTDAAKSLRALLLRKRAAPA